MQLTLTDHEADLMRGFLEHYLPALQREVARTERHDLRHLLVERQELVERVLERLGSKVA
jgi:hypothetical protein